VGQQVLPPIGEDFLSGDLVYSNFDCLGEFFCLEHGWESIIIVQS
jgi:hypothetical protein